MPVAERAKQFLPFSALKGLQEALEAKELATEQAADRPADREGSPPEPA